MYNHTILDYRLIIVHRICAFFFFPTFFYKEHTVFLAYL